MPFQPKPRTAAASRSRRNHVRRERTRMTGYAVARLEEIDEVDDGRRPFRPVRHHFGITSFGVTPGRPVTRATGSSTSTTSPTRTRARSSTSLCKAEPRSSSRRPGCRARRDVRACACRREADRVCRGPRDDVSRSAAPRGRGTSPTAGNLGPANPLYDAGEYAEAADRGRQLVEAHPQYPGCSTTSRVARASPGSPLTRSTTSGAQSSARSGFARSRGTIRTSIRSAISPSSRS